MRVGAPIDGDLQWEDACPEFSTGGCRSWPIVLTISVNKVRSIMGRGLANESNAFSSETEAERSLTGPAALAERRS